jgi:hypothetical protein
MRHVDREIGRLDPAARIEQLEHEVSVLRDLLDRAAFRAAVCELLILMARRF